MKEIVEHAARFTAHAWKVCIREIVSWVRIPLSPPKTRVIRR